MSDVAHESNTFTNRLFNILGAVIGCMHFTSSVRGQFKMAAHAMSYLKVHN